jgi:CelD/BcsL family acetyltransferase involved in cellulose biosynthesis
VINILTDISSLDSIKKEWNQLADLKKNPLLRHDWFLSCANSFYVDGTMRVVTVSSETGIHAIAPLVCVRKHGHEYLECIGVGFLGEPCDLLYDDENSLKQLLEALIGLRNPVILQRVSLDTANSYGLNTNNRQRTFLIRKNSAPSAYLSIMGSWENALSSRRKRDLRTVRNRAEKEGPVRAEVLCPTTDTLPGLLEKAFLIENSGWKGEGGSSLMANERLGSFFKAYGQLASENGILRICYLFIGESAIATLIGIEYANRFWVLKVGYNEVHARISPGIQLINETIRYAFSQKLDSYEFLGSDEPWLHMWQVAYRNYAVVGLYPRNRAGVVALGFDYAYRLLRKIDSLRRNGK